MDTGKYALKGAHHIDTSQFFKNSKKNKNKSEQPAPEVKQKTTLLNSFLQNNL